MNESSSHQDTVHDTGEPADQQPQPSGAIGRGIGVLALCIVVTIVFFATGLNLIVSQSGHPHGLPAAPFVGWLIAWAVGWGFMRLQVVATANQQSSNPRRGLSWTFWSMCTLALILISGF